MSLPRPLPSAYSRRASNTLIAARQAMASWVEVLGDPDVAELRDQVIRLSERVNERDNALQIECIALTSHPDFKAMQRGEIPWPMEPLARLRPICTCGDACPVCSGRSPRYEDEDGDCVGRVEHTCAEPCPAHGYARLER
jgi:hypothetical protein